MFGPLLALPGSVVKARCQFLMELILRVETELVPAQISSSSHPQQCREAACWWRRPQPEMDHLASTKMTAARAIIECFSEKVLSALV